MEARALKRSREESKRQYERDIRIARQVAARSPAPSDDEVASQSWLRENKHHEDNKQYNESYKKAISTYLEEQLARTKISYVKGKQLNTILEQLNQTDAQGITQLSAYVTKIKEITKHHTDTGLSGFLKFTLFRNPTSFNKINEVFDENNCLRPKIK